jgi:hypothetical protein
MRNEINFIRYPRFSEEHAGFSKSAFSRLLRECLISRYGKLPSASFVAREFNIRAYGCEPITQESARRWLRGLSIPTGNRLGVLQAWLKFDLNQLFSPASQYQEASLLGATTATSRGQSTAREDLPQSPSNQSDEFLKIWNDLSIAQKSALFVIAHQLREVTQNPPSAPAQQFAEGRTLLGSKVAPINSSNPKESCQ